MPKNKNTDYSKTVIYKIIPKFPKSIDDCYFGHCTTGLNGRFSSHKSTYKGYKENNKGHELSIFKLFDDYGGPDNCAIINIEDYPCDNKQEALKKEGEYILKHNCCNKHIPGNKTINILPTFHCDVCDETLYNSCKNKHEQTQKHLNNIKKQNNEKVESNLRKKIWYCECGNEKFKTSEHCNVCTNKNRVIQSNINGRPSYSELIKLKDINKMSMVKIGEKYNVSDNCIRKWIKLYEKHNLLD